MIDEMYFNVFIDRKYKGRLIFYRLFQNKMCVWNGIILNSIYLFAPETKKKIIIDGEL